MLKNKKGSSAIEVTIGLLVFILMFGFFYDLTIITWKFVVTTQVANSMSRVLAIQGGVMPYTPANFPGGDKAYITSEELVENVREQLEGKANIENYTVTINGVELDEGTNLSIDYGQKIVVEVTSYYDWDIFSDFLPFGSYLSGKKIVAKRSSLSEFKFNYDSWIGE